MCSALDERPGWRTALFSGNTLHQAQQSASRNRFARFSIGRTRTPMAWNGVLAWPNQSPKGSRWSQKC